MQLQEENPFYAEILGNILRVFGESPRGTTVPWEDFDRVLRFSHKDHGAGQYLLRKFQREVWQARQVRVWPRAHHGLRFMTEQEQVTVYPEMRMKRARRQQQRVLDTLEQTPTHNLSDADRRMANALEDLARAAIKRTRQTINILRRPDPKDSIPRQYATGLLMRVG